MRSSKFLLVGVVLLVAAFAGAQPQKTELNTITKVEVKGGAIEISGSRKPSFTTFTMTDPPRLVIDVSEAAFAGVPDEMQVGNGTVTAIKTASYGSGEHSIARILVGFTKDVETDIQTQEGKMVVKVLGAGGESAVAAAPEGDTGEQRVAAATPSTAAPTSPPPEEGSAQAAGQRAADERAAQQQAAKQAAQSAEQERLAQDKAAKESARAAEEDRKRQEIEARDAAKRAEADRLAQEKAAKESARASAEDEKRRQAEDAKAAAEEKRQKQEEARAAVVSERQRKADEAKAAAEEKRQKQEDAKAAAEAARKRKADEARAAAEEKRQKQEEARAAKQKGREVAMVEKPTRAAPSSSSSSAVSVSPRHKTITFLGFKQEAGASRVFVRTNEPARFTVSQGKGLVVLELENTGFGQANTRRPLDTSFFDTAVAGINPSAGARKGARIEIRLKGDAAYEAHQEGNEVYLEFPRPRR